MKPRRESHSYIRGHGATRAITDSTPITGQATLVFGCEDTTDRPASHPARPPLYNGRRDVSSATAGGPVTVARSYGTNPFSARRCIGRGRPRPRSRMWAAPKTYIRRDLHRHARARFADGAAGTRGIIYESPPAFMPCRRTVPDDVNGEPTSLKTSAAPCIGPEAISVRAGRTLAAVAVVATPGLSGGFVTPSC